MFGAGTPSIVTEMPVVRDGDARSIMIFQTATMVKSTKKLPTRASEEHMDDLAERQVVIETEAAATQSVEDRAKPN